MKTRRGFFALLGVAPFAGKAKEPCPVRIVVDKGPTVSITVPNMARGEIEALIAESWMPAGQAAHFKTVLRSAKDISLTLTSKCEVARPV